MKDYAVYPHAVDRAVERLGFDRSNAELRLRQLMQTAQYQGDTYSKKHGECRVFDHYKTGVRLIYSIKRDWIVTVYPMTKAESVALPAELLTELKRKAGAFLRKYMRRNRELERAIIEAKIEVLENERKKLRVNNPATKAVIDVKISDIQTQLDAMKAEQRELASKIAEVSAHA